MSETPRSRSLPAYDGEQLLVVFTEVAEERYWEMLEMLWPANWEFGGGFLVGEPADHRMCAVTNMIQLTYDAFVEFRGRYFEGDRAMTIPEWRRGWKEGHIEARLPEIGSLPGPRPT